MGALPMAFVDERLEAHPKATRAAVMFWGNGCLSLMFLLEAVSRCLGQLWLELEEEEWA